MRNGFAWVMFAAATGLMFPAAAPGAGSSSGAAPAAAKAGVAAPAGTRMRALATLRVDADSLRVTLELPKAALAATGVLRAQEQEPLNWKSAGGPPPPYEKGHPAVDRDSLRGYLGSRVFAIQDDGLLGLEIRKVTDPSPADPAFAQVELVAALLDTYTHIGFASGLFRELESPIPTQVRVEWREARAEFEASQAIQFIEPPAKGATTLELPGRQTPSAH